MYGGIEHGAEKFRHQEEQGRQDEYCTLRGRGTKDGDTTHQHLLLHRQLSIAM